MSDLSFHVKTYVPSAEGEELQHRESLLRARDYASALKANARSDRAYDYASDAHEMAGHFVFADAPIDRLKIAVAYCRYAVHAAYLVEYLDGERPNGH